MSYCRWSEDSDVYFIHNVNGYLECVGCEIEGKGSNQFIFRRDAIRHLRVHTSWGHKVPGYAFDRLESELEEEGNDVGEAVRWSSDEAEEEGQG